MPAVFIADREPLFRAGLRAVLGAERWRIAGETSEGRAVLAGCLKTRPELLLFDLRLDASRGLGAFARGIRALPDTRVLAFAGPGSLSGLLEARVAECGGHGLLPRDAPEALLLHAIHAVMAGERWFSRHSIARLLQVRARRVPVREEPFPGATERELAVARLLAAGLENQEIAARLGIAPRTVSARLGRLERRCGKRGRADLALHARRHLAGDESEG